MATNKNITMRQYNGVDYDTLYPKTIASQIDDVYSKNETSNLFLPKAGGSMGGILDMNGNRITNLPTPTSNSEPATKEYVDASLRDPLLGFTKICTLGKQNVNVGISFPTDHLAEMVLKLINCKINGQSNDGYLYFDKNDTQRIYLLRRGTVNSNASNCLFHFYPVGFSDSAYIFINDFGGSSRIEYRKTYTNVAVNFSYTGTMELYAKWFT